MERKGWGRALIGPGAITVAVLLLMRVSGISMKREAGYVAEALGALAMALAVRGGRRQAASVLAALGVLLAWLLDLIDGAMAFTYVAAGLRRAEGYIRAEKLHPAARAVVGAAAAVLAMALGTALTLLNARTMTPGAALGYAFARQLWRAAAYLVGGYIGLRQGREGRTP
ncbi:MAG: hypothetical protein VB067_02060 [Christensenellaceae bacterium]|nr:hypothetical protein [Christensenellaceae bacterium]